MKWVGGGAGGEGWDWWGGVIFLLVTKWVQLHVLCGPVALYVQHASCAVLRIRGRLWYSLLQLIISPECSAEKPAQFDILMLFGGGASRK